MYLLLRRTAALLLFVALTLFSPCVESRRHCLKSIPIFRTISRPPRSSRTGEIRIDYTTMAWFQDQMRRYQIGEAVRRGIQALSAPYGAAAPSPCAIATAGCSAGTHRGERSVPHLFDHPIGKDSFLELGRFDGFRLLSGYAVLGALRLGQPYILVSLSCILGYYARLKSRPLLAGICFGLFTPSNISP
jgi:hypothetical protein